MKQASHVIVLTSVKTKADAVRLANAAVTAKLAACAQFWPIQSAYHWKNRICSGREHLLLFKTRAAAAKSLQSFIQSRHPYELPEIVTLPIKAGLPPYLAWITSETRLDTMSKPLTFRRQATKRAVAEKRGKS